MGLFYTNMTLYRPIRESVLAVLRQQRRVAFLSPTVEGHTVVYDQIIDEEDANAIEGLGRTLTAELACSALAASLHDDDVLYLWLFHNGRVRDRYDSCPGYYDPDATRSVPPMGGNSKLLCKKFDRLERQERVEQLLRVDLLEETHPEMQRELQRHQLLATELGMPKSVAGLGYSAIAGNYVPKEFRRISFEAVHQQTKGKKKSQ
jgi:hypothetical protein